MICRLAQRRGLVILHLEGEFLFDHRHIFWRAMEQATRQGRSALCINLVSVNRIDSSGLAMLLKAHDDCQKERRGFYLVSQAGTVRQLLELSRLSAMIPTYETDQQLISRLQPA